MGESKREPMTARAYLYELQCTAEAIAGSAEKAEAALIQGNTSRAAEILANAAASVDLIKRRYADATIGIQAEHTS